MLDGIYPPRCLTCQELTAQGANLCAACWAETVFISGAVCDRCGTPLPGDPAPDLCCDGCLANPPEWDRGRAAVVYRGAGRRGVLAFKHGDRLDMARPLAGWLARAGPEILVRGEVIVPVPLHWSRLFRRKYNQSAELARHLGRMADVAVVPDMLVRQRATKLQEGMTRAERIDNQSGAFVLHRRRDVAGKRVVLVDDVMTTGATLSACAAVLREAGAAQIDALVLARVARDG